MEISILFKIKILNNKKRLKFNNVIDIMTNVIKIKESII